VETAGGGSANVLIDGSNHTLSGMDFSASKLIFNNVGNSDGNKGNHTIRNGFSLFTIQNDCNAPSQIIDCNPTATAITGTYAEKIVRISSGGMTVVTGGVKEYKSRTVAGSSAHLFTSEGTRTGGIAITWAGLYFWDSDAAIPSPFDPATLEAFDGSGIKITTGTVKLFKPVALSGATISGTATRGLTVESSNGAIAYVFTSSAGVSGGFMCSSSAAAREYFGFGAPNFASEASVIASAAGYYDSSNNVFLYHNISAANLSGAGAGITGLDAANLATGTVAPARLAMTETIRITFDGGGSVLTVAGSEVEFTIPYNCTITGWTLVADAAGNMTVEIDKSTYSAYPTMTSIVASAKPALATAQKNTDSTLTGWTTAWAAGSVGKAYLSGTPTVIKKATLTLNLLRT
jgi:hypothetical protein